jgi:hypothetical protein
MRTIIILNAYLIFLLTLVYNNAVELAIRHGIQQV